MIIVNVYLAHLPVNTNIVTMLDKIHATNQLKNAHIWIKMTNVCKVVQRKDILKLMRKIKQDVYSKRLHQSMII